MNIEKLNRLTKIDFKNFIPGENNVKYKIVIPFLNAFNHLDLDLEHAAQGSRIDINIGNRIIIETKALGINLNNYVQQLSDYSGRELPILAILTNGRNFKIYSPQWRIYRTFSEKILYEFELNELDNLQLVNRLEKILGYSNYESEEFIKHIEQREREIIDAKKGIDEIKNTKAVQVVELNNEISGLKEQAKEIVGLIKEKEKIVMSINTGKISEVEDQIKKYFLPFKKSQVFTQIVSDLNQTFDVTENNEESEIEKVKKRIPKWFQSPNQANHKILITYLKLLYDNDSVSLAELQKSCYEVPDFGTNYRAMKTIYPKNHGKIFEENNKQIFLWEHVKDFIVTEYKKFQGY